MLTWTLRFLLRNCTKIAYFKGQRLRRLHLKMQQVSPITSKLDSPQFHSIFTPELKTLSEVFQKHGFEIRVAGGAVRDILMGQEPHDLDFATTATPQQMKKIFADEEIRTINAKGEAHGTVTARINDKENFEVTTLRIDVVTDGRHARVDFTTDWQLDAQRRDLTINSLFLGLDGTVYDFVGGMEDVKRRRVAFVGDPETRIREDYLRILRYFRFYGRIANRPDGHEEQTLAAIRDNAEGLSRISGERIWTELRKILSGNYPSELLLLMLDVGLGPHLGLPNNCNRKELQKVWERSHDLCPQPMTLLAAALWDETEILKLHSRLKLSSYERDLGLFVVSHREDKPSEKPLRPYQSLVANSKSKMSDVREWVAEVMKYRGDPELLKDFEEWKMPRFPISGHALKAKGVSGKGMAKVIQMLKEIWIESDFRASPEEMLEKVPDIACKLGIKLDKVTEDGKHSV